MTGPVRVHDPLGPRFAPPLLIGVTLVLAVDRLLGLTALAVAPEAPVVGDRASGFLADLVAATLVVVVLLVLGAAGRPRGRRGLIAVVLVTGTVGLQVGVQVVAAVTGGEVATDAYLARALLLTGATVATSLILSSLAEHRATVQARSAARAHSEELTRAGQATLAGLREDVARQVRDVLREALEVLSADGSRGSGERLRALVDDVLRPLSRRLAAAPRALPAVGPQIAPARWTDLVGPLIRTPAVPARILAVTSTTLVLLRGLVSDQDAVRALAPSATDGPGGAGVGLGVSVDVVGLVASLAELVLVLGVTWWAAGRFARLLEGRWGRRSALAAWTVTVLGLVGVAALSLVGPAFVGWVVGVGIVIPGPVALLAAFVPLLVVTLGATVVRAVEQGREVLAADLVRQSARAAWTAARTQAVVAHEQHRLARTLHADVQAAVNAAGLMLDRADREGAVMPELVDDVAGRIAASVERVAAGDAPERSLTDGLDEIRGLWAGVCDVHADVAPEVVGRVDADAVTRELLVDLVGEACANAAVHGGASRVTVRLDLTSDGEVALVVEDDGTRGSGNGAPRASSRGGLGSEVLRASCTSFRITPGPAGTTLTASIPVG